jgi:S-adenosylmethionine/arginine decarboxylase-like enzyme
MTFVPNHIHMVCSILLQKPTRFTENRIRAWLEHLVEEIDMNVLSGPHVATCYDAGNEGITGIALLTTSHVSIHIWDRATKPYAQFDLYSCKEFDPQVVLEILQELDVVEIHYVTLDRNFAS